MNGTRGIPISYSDHGKCCGYNNTNTAGAREMKAEPLFSIKEVMIKEQVSRCVEEHLKKCIEVITREYVKELEYRLKLKMVPQKDQTFSLEIHIDDTSLYNQKLGG